MANYRAFIIPDPRATLWAAESTYTEQTSIVDTPERVSGETSLALSAAGSLSTAQSSKEINIQAVSSGLPSTAGYSWENNGDNLYRGADSPVVSRSWENIVWCSGATSPSSARYPSAITLADQTILVAYEEVTTLNKTICLQKYTPSTGTWAKVSPSPYSTTTLTATLQPTLVLLGSGTIILYHWLEDTTNEVAQVRSHYSTDSGDTWSVLTLYSLPSGIDTSGSPGGGTAGYAIGKLHGMEHNGQVALVAELVQNDTDQEDLDVFSQYVSSDNGATFSQVGAIWDGSTTADYVTTVSERGGSRAALVSLGSYLYLFYLETQWDKSYCQAPAWRKIGSCNDSFINSKVNYVGLGEWATLSSGTAGRGAGADETGISITDGELAAWTDERGNLYLAGRRTEGTQAGIVVSSGNSGQTWSRQGSSSATEGGLIWDFSDTATYLRELNATPAGGGGRVALLHSHVASPGDEDNSLSCLWLGGWTTVTLPSLRVRRAEIDSVSWNFSWLPMDTPNAVGWTSAGSGAVTLADGRLEMIPATAPANNSRVFSRNPSGAYSQGLMVRASYSVVTGGSTSNDRAVLIVRVADGSTECKVTIRASTTEFQVYDNVGAANRGSAVALDMTAGIDLIVALERGRIRTWYRSRTFGEDAEYIVGPTSAVSEDTSSPAGTNLVQFGRGAINNDTKLYWYELWYSASTYQGLTGERLSDGPANPGDLRPRELLSTGGYVTGGVAVSTIAGPAYRGDIHKVAVTSPLNLARALPTGPSSPRQGWESTAETEQTIALAISPSGLESTEASNPLSDVLGIALMGINIKTAVLQGYEIGGGGWTDLLTLEANSGDLSWSRAGSTVTPNSNTSTFYNHYQLSGATFKFDGGDAREVTSNTSGYWATGASYKSTALTLSGVDGGEGTSGTTGRIWFPNVYGVVRLNGNTYSAYRVKIAASQGTVSGTYKIGSICIGPVLLLSDQYSWGRSITTQRNIDSVESRDWSITSTKLSPSRRVIEVGWTDGVDENYISSNDTVSLSTAGGALPVGTKGSTLLQLEGLLRENGGEPIVYLPSIPSQSATGSTFTSPKDFVFCMIEGDIRRDAVVGEEGEELSRSPKLTLRELI